MDEEEANEEAKATTTTSADATSNITSLNDSMVAVCYNSGSCRIWRPFLVRILFTTMK